MGAEGVIGQEAAVVAKPLIKRMLGSAPVKRVLGFFRMGGDAAPAVQTVIQNGAQSAAPELQAALNNGAVHAVEGIIGADIKAAGEAANELRQAVGHPAPVTPSGQPITANGPLHIGDNHYYNMTPQSVVPPAGASPAVSTAATAAASEAAKPAPGLLKQAAAAVGKKVNTAATVGATTVGVVGGSAVVATPVYMLWSSAQGNAAIQHTAKETGKDPEVVKGFFNDFTNASGEGNNADAAFKDFEAAKAKGTVKEADRQKWIADRVAYDKLPWYGKIFDSIAKIFEDPKSFGAGSLALGGGLAAAGAWLGGGGIVGLLLAIPLALVGAVIPALMGNTNPAPTPDVPKKDAAKKDEGKTEEKKIEAPKALEPKTVTMTGVSNSMLGAISSQTLPKVDMVGNKDKAINPTV